MAQLKPPNGGGAGSPRPGLKSRIVDRVARSLAGDRLDELQQHLRTLEAEVQECRQLNMRLAEITDVLEQLLLPIADQDQERIAAALESYRRTL